MSEAEFRSPVAEAGPDRPRSISAIVTTYNWPQALDLVLDGLTRQVPAGVDFDIVIADDGSRDDTRALIERWIAASPTPIRHVWQDDDGFRAARARNLAIDAATGEYLLFLDGDGLVLPTLIATHANEARRGWFAVGRRCYMTEWASAKLLRQGWRPHRWPRAFLTAAALAGGSNRPLQLITLPQSEARRTNRPTAWNKAQTCHLGVWRADALAVSGFDESFTRYGLEDTDFVLRLIRSGVRRRTLEHADPVLHIWHPRRKSGEDAQARLTALCAATHTRPARSLLLDAARS